MSPNVMKMLINLWPPYLGAGVRVDTISRDYRRVAVSLKLRWYNRNYVGTHFGGTLFSMTDPFYMLMLMQVLGRDYIVWDKAGEIVFRKPGHGTVRARFALDEAVLDEIRAATAGGEKYLRWFDTEVVDAAGEVVARTRKRLYIRRKQRDADPAQVPAGQRDADWK